MIELLEKLEWWNKSEKQIQKLIPLLSNGDIDFVKKELKTILQQDGNYSDIMNKNIYGH